MRTFNPVRFLSVAVVIIFTGNTLFSHHQWVIALNRLQKNRMYS